MRLHDREMAGRERKVASTPKAGGTESRPRSHHRWYEQAITYLYLIRKDIYRGYRDRLALTWLSASMPR